MKIKATAAIILTTWLTIITSCFIALAATDAPHNASNNVNCGSCHGAGLLNSPFWGGTMSYDQLCLNCHKASSGPYSETNAPLAVTHSDSNGNALAECRTCHEPHYQKQKTYKNTDANNLYLATGTITLCSYNAGSGETTLTYSTITYKSGWDAAKLVKKTSDHRRTILFPHVNKLGYNYPIIAVDTPTANTITVKGNACVFPPPTTFAVMYGQYIRDVIVIDDIGTSKPVKFFDRTGTGSYADGDSTYNGICEVCHTQTDHFMNNGGAPDQNHANVCEAKGTNCITCHKHSNGLGHGGGGSETNCEDCHGHDDGWNGGTYYGTTFSHSTHTENDSDDLKGPFITCDTCHDANIFPCFKSGTDGNGDGRFNLSETDVCDNCHSPGGAFDGAQMAKDSWHEGVYASPTLRAGKEKWCAGCHDNDPAYSRPFDPVVDIVDNPEATYEGTWGSDELTEGKYGPDINYHEAGDGSSTATWVPDIPQNGDYDVYAWWPDHEVFATNAPYTIYYNGGSETIRVNQQINGGQWNLLGTFSFATGTSGSVVLSDDADGYVIADAIRVVNSDNYGFGVYAPNVIGDNSTYGFYVTGHKINCLSCHDANKNHLDHNSRTYEVSEVEADPNVIGIVVNPYCSSYRLKVIDGQPSMNVPRPGGNPIVNWQDFALCFNCHNRDEVLGVDTTDVSHTNFWDEYPTWYPVDCGLVSPTNSHYAHLAFNEDFCGGFQNTIHFDSDWDGVTYADSAESCITCHNVHGSPTGPMIRHGELISSYGKTDKVPALDFAYYKAHPHGAVIWRPNLTQAGTYGVYAWWKASASNITNAEYTIYYDGGSQIVTKNQQIDGSQWNLLGTYQFAAGTSGYVRLSGEGAGRYSNYVIADAMGWDIDSDGNPDIIVDCSKPGPCPEFSIEGGPDAYWVYRYAQGGAYPPSPGKADYFFHKFDISRDDNTTLEQSVGGEMINGTGHEISQNGVCNGCHGYSMAIWERIPFLGPQVLMPDAEPETISNSGSGTALLTVHILDHNDDVNTIEVNLSPLNGSSSQLMYDDGTNGDVTAGDNIYSYRVTVPDTVTAGDKSLSVTGTDVQSNTGTNTIKVTITNPG